MDITLYSVKCPRFIIRHYLSLSNGLISEIFSRMERSFFRMLGMIKIDEIMYVGIGYCGNNFKEWMHPCSFAFPNLSYYNIESHDIDFIISVLANGEKKRKLRRMKNIMKKYDEEEKLSYFTISY